MSTLFILLAGVVFVVRVILIQPEWTYDNWRNCEACGRALVRVGPSGPKTDRSLRKHLGHRLHSPSNITVIEYLKVWAGLL